MEHSDRHDRAGVWRHVLRFGLVVGTVALVGCQVAERLRQRRKPGAYDLEELLKGNPTTYEEMLDEAKDLRRTAYVIAQFPAAVRKEAKQRQVDAAKLLDRAEHWVRKAISSRPKQADGYHMLGNCLAQQGKHVAAITAYEEAVRRDPKLAKSHYCMGVVAFEQADESGADQQKEKYAEASRRWTEALKVDPKFYRSHYNLGVVAHRQERLADAKAEYGKALAIHPRHANAKLNLGLILATREHDLKGAIKLWQEIVAHNPGHIRAQYNLARAAIEDKNYDQAEKHWLGATEGTPADASEQALRAEAWYRLAILYEDIHKDLGKSRNAILSACKIEELNKTYRQFLRRVERQILMRGR